MVFPISDGLPTRRPAIVNNLLMIACFLVWLMQQVSGHADLDALRYGFVPYFLFEGLPADYDIGAVPSVFTLVTYAFLHGSFWHLGGNMLFLWIFGNNVEDALGHLGYLGFYLFCAVMGALVEGLADPLSKAPLVGASGAISGVLGAYLMLYPRQPVVLLVGFFPLPVPAFIAIGAWFVIQVVDGISGAASAESVAWLAHVGGFVVGVGLIRPFRKQLRPWRGPWD